VREDQDKRSRGRSGKVERWLDFGDCIKKDLESLCDKVQIEKRPRSQRRRSEKRSSLDRSGGRGGPQDERTGSFNTPGSSQGQEGVDLAKEKKKKGPKSLLMMSRAIANKGRRDETERRKDWSCLASRQESQTNKREEQHRSRKKRRVIPDRAARPAKNTKKNRDEKRRSISPRTGLNFLSSEIQRLSQTEKQNCQKKNRFQ